LLSELLVGDVTVGGDDGAKILDAAALWVAREQEVSLPHRLVRVVIDPFVIHGRPQG
jgi:hypothetical protein